MHKGEYFIIQCHGCIAILPVNVCMSEKMSDCQNLRMRHEHREWTISCTNMYNITSQQIFYLVCPFALERNDSHKISFVIQFYWKIEYYKSCSNVIFRQRYLEQPKTLKTNCIQSQSVNIVSVKIRIYIAFSDHWISIIIFGLFSKPLELPVSTTIKSENQWHCVMWMYVIRLKNGDRQRVK